LLVHCRSPWVRMPRKHHTRSVPVKQLDKGIGDT
jgi:hypothetical protein